MDKRPGRFTVNKATMRVGTEIYREIVKKMLSAHIAVVERKMRACVQCPPRCPELPKQDLRQNPYTRPYKKQPFIPRTMLSTYVTNRLRRAERVKKGKLTLEEEKKERRVLELKEKKLREWNGRIDKAEEATKHRKQMVVAQIRALQSDAAKLTSLRDQVSGEQKEEYDAAVVQAREDIQQIVQGGDQEQMENDFQSVSDNVAKKGPVPNDLFKDVPEDLNQLTPTVEVRAATQDEIEVQPIAFADDTFDEDGGEIPDADAANPEVGIDDFAASAIASVGFEEGFREGEAAMQIDEGEIDDEPDEKAADLPNRADDLAALLAGRLAAVTGTDSERKAKRQKWRKSTGGFWGQVKHGGWPGPGDMPEWAQHIYTGTYVRRRKFLETLLRGRSGIDKAEAWIPIIKKQFAEPEHAWIVGAEEEEDDPIEEAVIEDQPPIAHYFDQLPAGLTADDVRMLDRIYGDLWQQHTAEATADQPVGEFALEGVPIAHFKRLAAAHREAFKLAPGHGQLAAHFILPEDYQPLFYKVCVDAGSESFATSTAKTLGEFEEEVYAILDVRDDAKLMWKVPEVIRAKDGWPSGDKEELPVIAKNIHHLFCPVWQNQRRVQAGQSITVISYGTQPHISCQVPDLEAYGSIPINIQQLRLANEEDIENNPNVFGEDAPDIAGAYSPGSDMLSAYPDSENFTVEGGEEGEEEEEQGEEEDE